MKVLLISMQDIQFEKDDEMVVEVQRVSTVIHPLAARVEDYMSSPFSQRSMVR